MVTPFPEDADRIVGGVAGVASYLAAELAERPDCEIVVIAPSARRTRSASLGNFDVHYLGAIRGPGVATYWTVERSRISRMLGEIEPDVVHYQGVAGWAFGCPRPSVLTLHGLTERDTLFSSGPLPRLRSRIVSATEGCARSRFQHVISISPYLEQEIGHQLKGRVWRIENPISEEFFRIRRQDDGHSVLFLGRITHRKNVLGALRAAAKAAKVVDVRLRIGGDAPDPEYLEQCQWVARELGIADRVDWLGSLSSDQTRAELARASCLVLPSFQETAPLAIEEAMGAGVPVLASNVCGIPHLVAEGRSGFLHSPEDDERASAALVELLRSTELRDRLGRAGRAEAEQRFRGSVVAAQTVAVYRAAAERRPQ
jgi:glycosyltransferase involved in cell wall biosynthesis